MGAQDVLVLGAQLAMGFALAATAGLRAFLPLFVVGLAAHFGHVHLGPAFQWMAGTPALVIFGSAVVFEFLADKVPGLDHAMHAFGLVAAPIAGLLLMASTTPIDDPVTASAVGLIAGVPTAMALHGARAATRPLVSAFTAGLGNPFVSFTEDVLAVAGIGAALLVPILAAVVALALVIVGAFALRRLLVRRSRAEPASPTEPALQTRP